MYAYKVFSMIVLLLHCSFSFVAAMAKVHLTSGSSSRRRRRTHEIDSAFTKRYKSDYEQDVSQPLSCSSDQSVPCNDDSDVFSAAIDCEQQTDFFDDPFIHYGIDEKVEDHPLGSFSVLPPEIFHLVLRLLENSALDALASTSGEMCAAVSGFVYTLGGLNLVLPQYSEGDFAEPLDFNCLGD